jgi:hypothetical protein
MNMWEIFCTLRRTAQVTGVARFIHELKREFFSIGIWLILRFKFVSEDYVVQYLD